MAKKEKYVNFESEMNWKRLKQRIRNARKFKWVFRQSKLIFEWKTSIRIDTNEEEQ
jgi:hypothetical protein